MERIFLGQGASYSDSRDATRYCQLLTRLWARAESILLVEHDIEIRRGIVREAAECPEPWCAWPYQGMGWSGPGDALIYESLGCTKFSADLMRAEPDALLVAGALSQGLQAGDWRRMDVTILSTLRERGYLPHRHWPPVLHHHKYPEGCACGKEHE